MAGKRLKASERKEEIIKAAIEVVAQTNFDKATIADIAKTAHINESLIYQHFDNKIELMESVLDYIREDMYRIMISSSGLDDPSLSSLRQAGIKYYESAKFRVDMVKCLFASTMASDNKLKSKAIQHIKFFQNFIEARVKLAMENNLVDPSFDAEIIAYALFGVTTMSSVMLILGEGDLIPIERVDQLFEQLEELIKPK